MNNRLQQFLDLENLRPAQFADIMGIQRSSVTHILSGRNKPGFDFIQKFLLKFPSVNPDWFLLGRGKPLREQNTSAPAPRTIDTSPELFASPLEVELSGPPDSGNDVQMPEENGTGAPSRDVRRITLFYCDGTFQEFYPPK